MTFPGRDSRISAFYHWYTVFYDSLRMYPTQTFYGDRPTFGYTSEFRGLGLHGNGIRGRRDFFSSEVVWGFYYTKHRAS